MLCNQHDRFVGAEFAFPHNQYSPALCSQRRIFQGIAANIPFQFRTPIFEFRPGESATGAVPMLMPKATSDLYGQPSRGEHDVRLSRQIPAADSEPHPRSVQSRSQPDLGACVSSLDPSHVGGASGGVNGVGHG